MLIFCTAAKLKPINTAATGQTVCPSSDTLHCMRWFVRGTQRPSRCTRREFSWSTLFGHDSRRSLFVIRSTALVLTGIHQQRLHEVHQSHSNSTSMNLNDFITVVRDQTIIVAVKTNVQRTAFVLIIDVKLCKLWKCVCRG